MSRCVLAAALSLVALSGCRQSGSPAPPVPAHPEACDLSLFEARAAGGCEWSRLHAGSGDRTPIAAIASSCAGLSIAWGADHRRALLAVERQTPTPSPTPAPHSRQRTVLVVATPPPPPTFDVEEIDFTTGRRRSLAAPPDGDIVAFGWSNEGRPLVLSFVPLSTMDNPIWARVRAMSGMKDAPVCDPGAAYAFAETADGFELVKSVYGDCETGQNARVEDLGIGLSGLLTGYRTPYRNASKEERRVIGATSGGVVFETNYGEIVAAGDDGQVRIPLAFLAGGNTLALDLPEGLVLQGGVRERCLLVSEQPDREHPRLYGLDEKRILFRSDTAMGASFWPIVHGTAR